MAISRILSWTIIHLSLAYARPPVNRDRRSKTAATAHVMRRYPGIHRTGCPSPVLSCTAWGFSCLANYSASGELLPRLFTLTCALLPKNRRCLFCDTFRQSDLAIELPAYSTRHAAVWCSDFPLTNLAAHQRSPAIGARIPHSSVAAFAGMLRAIAMGSRYQSRQDGLRPPTIGNAMAMSSYYRRDNRTSNRASPDRSFGCRSLGISALACRRVH